MYRSRLKDARHSQISNGGAWSAIRTFRLARNFRIAGHPACKGSEFSGRLLNHKPHFAAIWQTCDLAVNVAEESNVFIKVGDVG